MVERDPDANERLIVRARAKASRRGTTLEAELVAWLERYVEMPDDALGDRQIAGASPHRPRPPVAALPLQRPRSAERPRTPPSTGDDSGSRTLAYQRLLVSMRAPSQRSPRGRDESER